MFIVLGAGSARGQRIYATTETHSPKQSALITLSEVRDPTFAVDGNNGTYSTLYTSLGLLSLVEAWQNVQFPTQPPSNSPFTIKFGTSGSSILSVLDGVELQPSLNGGTVGSPYSNATIIGLLAAGSTDSEITLPAPGVAYNGLRYKVTSTLALSLSGRLWYAFYITPPTIGNQTICNNSAVTLTVSNPQSGYTYNWYSTSTGGTALKSGTSTTFSPSPNLTSTTTYYVEAVETATGTSYYSGRTPVTVTVNNPPTTATTGANQSLCSTTTTTLTGNTPTTGTGAWSQVSGPNTAGITSPASSTTGITGMVAGTYVFRWTISNGVCLASTSDVTIVVSTIPTIALGTAPSACKEITSSTMIYTGTTGSPVTYSITWGASALTAGFTNVSNASLPSSPISLTVPGSGAVGSYSGSITVKNAAGCESTSVPFTFTIHPKPAAPHIITQ
jgi:hypothetical protein